MRRAAIGIVVTSLGVLSLACSGGSDKPATPTPDRPVFIESISPTSGTIGDEIVIRGHGFTAKDNDIAFSGADFGGRETAYQGGVRSADGETVRFELDEFLGLCAFSQLGPDELCASAGVDLPSGELTVSIVNRKGTSNGVAFNREIGRIEEAEDAIYGSRSFGDMMEGLNEIVGLGGTAYGIGIEESEDGEIYVELTASGMADSELRDLVPEEIEGYEVRVTRNPAPPYY